MYAVIENGGRQYKVTQGQKLALDKFSAKAGDKLTLDKVLMLANGSKTEVGTPFIKGVAVEAEVLGDAAGDKVIVFKKKRRKNYRRTIGHRQKFTVVEIKSITGAKTTTAKTTGTAKTTESTTKATTSPQKSPTQKVPAEKAPEKATEKVPAEKAKEKVKDGS